MTDGKRADSRAEVGRLLEEVEAALEDHVDAALCEARKGKMFEALEELAAAQTTWPMYATLRWWLDRQDRQAGGE